MVAEGLGFPQSCRAPAATALTGFQLATVCNHPGMCCVGTSAFDTNTSGNRTMKPKDVADSGLLLLSPTHAAIQEME